MITNLASTPALRVLRGATSGRSFELDRDVTLLGRDTACDVVIQSQTVSRRHARIERRKDGYYLVDQGSTSGTAVNGRIVDEPACLRDGDVVELGDVLLVFSGSLPEPLERTAGESTVLKVRDATGSAEHNLAGIRAEEKLRAFLEIGRALVGSLDLEHVLQNVLDALFALFPQAERGFVVLGEPGQAELVPQAMKLRPDEPGQQVTVSRTVFDYVTRLGKAVLSADVMVDRRFDGSRSVDEAQIRTMMCVPLHDHERRPVGILQLDTTQRQAQFRPDDLDLLAAMAGQVGVAVEKARLLDAARDARSQAEAAQLRAEEAKRQAEEAGRAKDRFLAMLSHELRTPLTPAILAISGLLDDPRTPAAIRPELEAARRGIALEARLVDDLLDLTRIDAGKLRLELGRVDIHALLHQALAACGDELGTDPARLVLDLAAAESHVDGDSARLQQVLWNLIKNAAKFTPSPGTITIRTRNEPGAPGRRVVLEVSDTGIGIEPDILPRIFTVFEQGSDAVTRRFGGLGLGLAISRAIAEMHDGRLTAASAGPGQGSTFRLDLAASASASAEPALAPSRPADEGRDPSPWPSRILLVEDNADTLRILARLLGRRGYQVTTATDIASALARAAETEFDLVISDIGLTDGSGLDLLPRIRAHRPNIPGIALSGYGMEEDLRRSAEAGYVAHLIKPIDLADLETAIRRHLRAPSP